MQHKSGSGRKTAKLVCYTAGIAYSGGALNRTTWSFKTDGRRQVVIAIDRLPVGFPDIPCVEVWSNGGLQVTAVFYAGSSVDFCVMHYILVYFGLRGCFVGDARDAATGAFWHPLH